MDGRQKVLYALTAIRGVGRRFSHLVCKKADVSLEKRYAGLGGEGKRTEICGRCRLADARVLPTCLWWMCSAGELTPEEIDRIVAVIQNPSQFKIPEWFLNRRRDRVTGKSGQVTANMLDQQLREDIRAMYSMKLHRGLRHAWGVRVRGQMTKTTGRKGRTMGVSKKKG